MKNGLSILLFLSVIVTSCARYESSTLCAFPVERIHEIQGVSIAARAFTKKDCKHYLDRDVLCKGYQPVQIYIKNSSESSYLFSTTRVTLPTVDPEEVSKKVHSSTVGRIAGYGAAALLASPLFAVPAVIDGYKSAEANDTLDQDFLAKGAHDCVIAPHSFANMILFVPKEEYQETFSVTLIDENTNKPIKIIASTR